MRARSSPARPFPCIRHASSAFSQLTKGNNVKRNITPVLQPDPLPSKLDDEAFRIERAKLGGEAKAELRSERQQSAAAALPPLVTEQDALKRLEMIGEYAVGGIIAGTQANAAVQSVRVWLEVQRLAITSERIRRNERRIVELETQLAQARGRLTS